MIQTELYLPRPFTAAEHASALGRLGGIARAERQRRPIREKAAQIRKELNLPEDRRLLG